MRIQSSKLREHTAVEARVYGMDCWYRVFGRRLFSPGKASHSHFPVSTRVMYSSLTHVSPATPSATWGLSYRGRSMLQGHVCRGVLISGFQAGLDIRQRLDSVDKALESATLLTDLSHWGIIRVQGEDRLRFLHSQGTNAFEETTEGG